MDVTPPLPQPWSPRDPAALGVLADPYRVVAFLGAGMVMPCGLPDAAGLTSLLQGSSLAAGLDFSDGPPLVETVDMIARARSLAGVQQLIAGEIGRASAGAEPPDTYQHLVSIPSRWIVTFNYDTLVEKAARAAGRPVRSATWRDDAELADLRAGYVHPADKGEDLIVLHLHGSVDDPSSIVAEHSCYRQASKSPSLRALLVALLSTHRGVWLGTALDEPWVQVLLTELSTGAVQHCYIGDQTSVQAARAGRGQLSVGMHGMAFDGFPAGRFEHLPEFCEWLVEKQPVSSAPLHSGSGRGHANAVGGADARVVIADWGPEWTRKALDALASAHPDEFVALKDALSAGEVENLLAAPPGWLADGSWQLWIATARFAEEHGNWPLAADAWQQAAGRSGADRARCLVGAATAASMAGDEDHAAASAAAARDVDPDHPRLKLHLAGDIDDPAEQLDAVAALFSQDGDIGAMARCHAVVCCLLLGRDNEAQTHLDAAERLAPDIKQVRICRINTDVHRGRSAVSDHGRVHAVQLQAAKEDALALRDELHRQHRWSESCRLLMLAADATALQGELEDAAALLRTAREEERRTRDQRIVLADAALRAQAHADALTLLNGLDAAPDVDAMRAQATLRTGDEAERRSAWDSLVELLADEHAEDHVRRRSAHALLLSSWLLDDVEFPDPAAQFVAAEGNLREPTVSRAFYEHRAGDAPAARELLQAHEPSGWAFEAALQLALWDDDVDEIFRLAERVLRETTDPHLRLLCAVRLDDAGQRDRCREIASAIAQDETLPARDRGEAFAVLADVIVEREGDHQEGLKWLNRWAHAVPDDRRHIWGRIQSMLRLGLHDDAVTLLLSTSAPIETRAEAQLAAQAYLLMPDRVDGLRRLADLLDSLPHDDPWLRQRAFAGLLNAGEGVPEELAERLRLPEGVEMPGEAVTWEQLVERLRERHERVEQATADVLSGEGAVTKLAEAAGLELTAAWQGLGVKPAGFGRTEWAEPDRADALHALERGAVADPTALVTLTLLPDDVARTARRRLFGPLRIAQSAVDDVVAAAVDGAGTGQSLVLDPQDGEPVALQDTEDALQARRDALAAIRDLAVEQRAEPDVRPEQPTALDAFLGERERPSAAKALAGSVAVAQRTGRPLYADDRVTRRIARQLGLPTFDTSALLSALVSVNALTEVQAAEAMAALRAAGYAGVPPIDGESERLCTNPDSHRDELHAFVSDRLLWAAGGLEHFLRLLEVLHRLYEHDATRFPSFAEEVLVWAADAAHYDPELPRSVRDRDEMVPELLAMLAMLVTTAHRVRSPFFPELYRQLERFAHARTGSRRGEIIEVAGQWMQNRFGGLTLHAYAQLPLWHQMRLVGIDPNAPSPRELSPAALDRVLAQLPVPRRRPTPSGPWRPGARR